MADSLLKDILLKTPITLEKFLKEVLYGEYGYYSHNKVVGSKGDFITSPEISQSFGDLISLFFIEKIASFIESNPNNSEICFLEMGPGRGTFLKDFLRVLSQYKKIYEKTNIYLYECSDYLKSLQIENNKNHIEKIKWIDSLTDLPETPLFVFANEFFDSLPICQKSNDHIVLVDSDKSGNLFLSKTEEILEIPNMEIKVIDDISNHIKKHSGGMLVIDYGYIENTKKISTLQSIHKHKRCGVFENLGSADISHHVDFKRLYNQLLENGFNTSKTVTQKQFLENLGINEYIKKFLPYVEESNKSNFITGATRLISPQHMGEIFKVIWCDFYAIV